MNVVVASSSGNLCDFIFRLLEVLLVFCTKVFSSIVCASYGTEAVLFSDGSSLQCRSSW